MAVGRRQEPGEHAEQRRLPAADGSHHGDARTSGHVERDVLQGRRHVVAVAEGDLVEAEALEGPGRRRVVGPLHDAGMVEHLALAIDADERLPRRHEQVGQVHHRVQEHVEVDVQRHQRAERQVALDHAEAAEGEHDHLADARDDVIELVNEHDEHLELQLDADAFLQDVREAPLLPAVGVERLHDADAAEGRLDEVVRPGDGLLLRAVHGPELAPGQVEDVEHHGDRRHRHERQLPVEQHHGEHAEHELRQRVDEPEHARAGEPGDARVVGDVVGETGDEVAGAVGAEEAVVLLQHRAEDALADRLLDDVVHPGAEARIEADDQPADEDHPEDALDRPEPLAQRSRLDRVDGPPEGERVEDRQAGREQRQHQQAGREPLVRPPEAGEPPDAIPVRGDGRRHATSPSSNCRSKRSR